MPDGDTLHVAATVGQCAEMQGCEIGLTTSTTGRVVHTGEPLLTHNILAEPDAQAGLNPAGTARGAMIAPLKTSSGVAGAVGVVRYLRTGAEQPLPFTLMELQYLTAVAAYIAGGLELSEAVSGARASTRWSEISLGERPSASRCVSSAWASDGMPNRRHPAWLSCRTRPLRLTSAIGSGLPSTMAWARSAAARAPLTASDSSSPPAI